MRIGVDIDGVLNTEQYRESPDVDYFENPISETHMCLLECLVKMTGAKIILSSTWRIYWTKSEKQYDRFGEYINNLFEKYGLEIFDKTPELEDRDIEITEWIKASKRKLDSFVIIDDFDFEWSVANKEHLIKTLDTVGLDEDAVNKAIHILNKIY